MVEHGGQGELGLQSWRQGTFKISQDPRFNDKVRNVVGLYLNPPEGEVVVSVDAKSGIQALDCTQPLLPIGFGKTQKRAFDYARRGTTDLYAAINVRSGEVITSLSQSHATAGDKEPPNRRAITHVFSQVLSWCPISGRSQGRPPDSTLTGPIEDGALG